MATKKKHVFTPFHSKRRKERVRFDYDRKEYGNAEAHAEIQIRTWLELTHAAGTLDSHINISKFNREISPPGKGQLSLVYSL